MIAYHTTRDELSGSDSISPSTYFFDHLDQDQAKVEKIIAQNRPCEKPSRKESKFIFTDLESAKNRASRIDSKLYEVDYEESNLMHRADWSWLGKIKASLGDDKLCEKYAKSYWSEEKTEAPVIELLVSEAAVISEIEIPVEERRSRKASQLGQPPPEEIAKQFFK